MICVNKSDLDPERIFSSRLEKHLNTDQYLLMSIKENTGLKEFFNQLNAKIDNLDNSFVSLSIVSRDSLRIIDINPAINPKKVDKNKFLGILGFTGTLSMKGFSIILHGTEF